MPTLPEILNQLQFISQETALLGLFVTAGFILVGRDWRLLILALLAQYILVGLALSRLVRPDIAVLKIMIGAFICPILFLSARQVSISAPLFSPIKDKRYRVSSPTGVVFRLLAALLMILITLTLSQMFRLPGLSPSLTIAVYWLSLAGLTILILTEDPLKVGHGLLTVLTGFDLFYTTLERSLLITGLWGSINLLIALALSYLIVAKGAAPEEEQ
ncbi:MAG: hypothetical protein JW953_20975 [Anaerolineae bacterium]|nr:hypothetical protein [Anaerolineae bacterium]